MVEGDRSAERGGGLFTTTQWSLVLAAGDSRSPDSREALAALCEAYWYPVYALIRHLGHDVESARDSAQGFFTFLLEKQVLKVARPDRGRFRAFLKTSLRHYLGHERQRARAQKRGGGQTPLSLDFDEAESRFRLEPSHEQTPEVLFEKRWARTLMTCALERLRQEPANAGDKERIRRLEPFLTGPVVDGAYEEVADALGMTVPAVRTAVRRMRKRYGDYLRAEVARTVSAPGEVDEELRYLFSVIRS
jgi:RNA polymerase sigma-70 factor (ECF subfamily)